MTKIRYEDKVDIGQIKTILNVVSIEAKLGKEDFFISVDKTLTQAEIANLKAYFASKGYNVSNWVIT